MDIRIRNATVGLAALGGIAAATVLMPTEAAPQGVGTLPVVTSAVSGTPDCKTGQLRVRLGGLEAAAGTSYRAIRFVNTSRHACKLSGYPRIALLNGHGIKIGYAASRYVMAHRPVRIRPGHHAVGSLAVGDPGNYRPADCLAHRSRQIRVRVPGTHDVQVRRYRTYFCTTQYGRPGSLPVSAP